MIASETQFILAEIQAPVLAGSVGAALTLTLRKCGFHFRLCRTPLAHHTHREPVPRIGGLAIFVAIALGWGVTQFIFRDYGWSSTLAIVVAAFPVLLVGAY